MKYTAALPFALLALAAAAVASGCGAHGQVAGPTITPTPLPVPTASCLPQIPSGEMVQMVFPAPGTTGAPTSQGIVVAVAPNPLPTNWYIYVTSVFGNAPNGGLQPPAAVPTALPTPNASPAFANPIYQFAPFGIFATGTTFSVFLANNTCYPGVSLGDFTT